MALRTGEGGLLIPSLRYGVAFARRRGYGRLRNLTLGNGNTVA